MMVAHCVAEMSAARKNMHVTPQEQQHDTQGGCWNMHVDISLQGGCTPLLIATSNGHVGVVKALLEMDDRCSPDTSDEVR